MDDTTHGKQPSDRANILILAVVLALVTTFFALADNFLSGEDRQPEAVTAALQAAP